MKRTKKPNLFIVGAPKCGTTSMHDYLSQHPEIFMSEHKEPGYFAKDLFKESDNFHNKQKFLLKRRNLNSYLDCFQKANKEKIIGESSTIYIASKKAPGKISEFNKTSKIIIMLREPVDFMFSLHSQFLSQGDEEEKDFKKALELEKKRKKGKKIPNTATIPSRLLYKENAKFSKQIANYLNYFPNENIKVILLDELKSAPLKVYKDVLKFLNVHNIDFKPEFEIKNARTECRSIFFQKIIKDPDFKIKIILKKVLSERSIQKLHKILRDMNLKKTKSKLDTNLKTNLKKELKFEVIKLNKLLHKNNLIDKNTNLQKLWGYDKLQ